MEQHPQVTFKALPANRGAAAARLAGARLARNDWIAPVDSDDYVGPNAVSEAYYRAIADNADMCIWTMHRVSEKSSTRWPDLNSLSFPITGRCAAGLTLGEWRIHPSGVVRKQAFLQAAASVEVDAFNSDELVTRRLFMACKVVTACQASYYYVDNPNSTGHRLDHDASELVRSHAWLLRFALEQGFLDDDPALAHVMVRQGLHLAEELQQRSVRAEIGPFLALLALCSPSLTSTGFKELYRTYRGRGSRQRLLALMSAATP